MRLGEEAALVEAAQDAAEVTGIETEVGGELRCRRPLALGEFVEHARFGERIGALQEAIPQHADPACIEAIEAADRADALLEIDRGAGRHGECLGHNVT